MKWNEILASSYFTFSRKGLLNKYVLTTIVFLLWITIIDRNSIPVNVKLSRAISKLEKSKADYEQKIIEAREIKKDLEENREKYAREKYFMHKEGEDVIIIEKAKK